MYSCSVVLLQLTSALAARSRGTARLRPLRAEANLEVEQLKAVPIDSLLDLVTAVNEDQERKTTFVIRKSVQYPASSFKADSR